jgi:prepilin-type processing-associated H-X9-DG protein
MGFHLFAHDHDSRFPMQTPESDGGSLEYAQSGASLDEFYFSYRHFQALSRELTTPQILACPSDSARLPAMKFDALQNSNVSYFVNVAAEFGKSDSVLAGDRNITNNFSPSSTVVRGTYGLRWTRELHFYKGNVLFSDGHVEELNNLRLDLPAAQAANTYLVVPSTPSSSSSPESSPSSQSTSSSSGGNSSQPASRNPADKAGSAKPPAPPVKPPPHSGGKATASSSSSMEIVASTPSTFDVAPPPPVVSNPPPVKLSTNAPPAEDPDEETPLQWITKNFRALIAKMSWWMLLLIRMLLAVMLYL